MGEHLLSIIIPTRNRHKYIVKTIDTVLSLGENIELVVADTSDVDELSGFIAKHPCAYQIKHVRPGAGRSVVDNFNAGLLAASGDYIVFLGDDDFITKDILSVVEWAETNKIDSVKFTFPALYYWPDFRHTRRGDAFAGTLRIAEFTGQVKKHDAKEALFESLESFGDGPINMPRAYLGMISKSLVERVLEKYGALFGGVSPDVYSASLISMEANSCVLIDYPIVIPGASSASTSGQTAEGKHIGKLRENAHIAAFKNLEWDKRIPEFYSVPTVWSYSLLKGVEKLGISDEHVNYARLFVKCMFYHFQYRREIFKSFVIHSKGKYFLLFWLRFPLAVVRELRWLSGKAFARLRPLYHDKTQDDDVLVSLKDVKVAHAKLAEYLEKKEPCLILKKIK